MVSMLLTIAAAGLAAHPGTPVALAQDAAQVDASAGGAFARADANGDAKLDTAEVTALLQQRAAKKAGGGAVEPVKPRKVARFIERADTDGDGAVSEAEMSARRANRADAKADAE